MKVNCKQAVGDLAEYLDRALPQDMREAIVGHMKRCPACVTFTETYKKTTVLCRKALMKEAPSGLTERVLAFVREHTRD
jgi:anti-sigma factor RsiW